MAPPARTGAPRATWLIVLFWISLAAVVYLSMNMYLRPTVSRASVGSGGAREVVIERSRDGYYYVAGAVNGVPVTFMVDTGAGTVTVGPDIARAARLASGAPVALDTAGGRVTGELTNNVRVSVADIAVDDLRVVVAPSMAGAEHALLGQNFLRHLSVSQRDDRMTLRLP